MNAETIGVVALAGTVAVVLGAVVLGAGADTRANRRIDRAMASGRARMRAKGIPVRSPIARRRSPRWAPAS
jgi:hypothetical protein